MNKNSILTVLLSSLFFFISCQKKISNKNVNSVKSTKNINELDSSFIYLHNTPINILEKMSCWNLDNWNFNGYQFGYSSCAYDKNCEQIFTINNKKYNLSKEYSYDVRIMPDSCYYINSLKHDYIVIKNIPTIGRTRTPIYWLIVEIEFKGKFSFHSFSNDIESIYCLGDFNNDDYLDIIDNGYSDDISEARITSTHNEKQILQEKKLFLKHSYKRLNEMDSIASFLPFDIIDIKRTKW